MSLEKLAEASDGSRKTERLQRRWSGERKPPPKPPHTYYNKHRYPDEEEEPRSSGDSSLCQCWVDVDCPGLHPGDTVSLLSASCIRFRVGVEEQSGGGLTGTLHTAYVFNHLILCCIAATQPPDIQPAPAAAPPPSPPLNTSSSSTENLQAADDSVGKDKSKKSVFRKLFTKK